MNEAGGADQEDMNEAGGADQADVNEAGGAGQAGMNTQAFVNAVQPLCAALIDAEFPGFAGVTEEELLEALQGKDLGNLIANAQHKIANELGGGVIDFDALYASLLQVNPAMSNIALGVFADPQVSRAIQDVSDTFEETRLAARYGLPVPVMYTRLAQLAADAPDLAGWSGAERFEHADHALSAPVGAHENANADAAPLSADAHRALWNAYCSFARPANDAGNLE